jgi:hypothetical protein
MVTPESNKTPLGLKDQLQVALAAAIGLVAGAILWEAIFLTEDSSLPWRLARWMGVIVLGGSVTLAWACGALRHPEQTAKFGALTGAIVAGSLNLGFWFFGATPGQPFYHQVDTMILYIFQYGFYGFLGGLALEKRWGRYSAVGVALGVAVAGILATFIQAFFIDSIPPPQPETSLDSAHLRVFSDLAFWNYELSRHLLMTAGWALALALLPKSAAVLQHDEAHQRRHSHARESGADSFSRKEPAKVPAFKDQFESAVTATIGVSAALILWYSIFERGMLAWNRDTLGFFLSIAFSVCLSLRYLDPFFERVRGDSEHPLISGSRFRRVSLLSVSVTVPVAVIMQLNDKFMTDDPSSMALWVIAALSGGAITLAWARGISRSPCRAAEFGALTGTIVPSVVIIGLHAYAGRQGIDHTIIVVTSGILEWGLYGLLGGLAIERGRATGLPMRVGLGIGAAGLIVCVGLGTALIGVFNSQGFPAWVKTLSRVLLITSGWVWGLMLFPKSDSVLGVPKEARERGCGAPAEKTV